MSLGSVITDFIKNFLYDRLVRLADRARDDGRWEESANLYSRAVRIYPNKAAIWVQAGNVSKEAKQFVRAKKAYDTALKLNPNNADTHLQLGHLFKVMGDATASQASYVRAQQIDPTDKNVALELSPLPLPPGQSPAIRPVRPPIRRLSFNARVVNARSELDYLIRANDVTRHGRDEAAWDHAKPALAEAMRALDAILAQSRALRQVSGDLETGSVGYDGEPGEIVFDVSDLIQYFRNHRLPTGIQRVQIEIISIAIMRSMQNTRVRVCCFTEETDFWREVPLADFVQLCELSSIDNDWMGSDWRDAMQVLEDTMQSSPDFQFSTGAFLINIGTSWWLQNYFLYVREAKRRKGIKYIPFVHDLIPIITPEFCVEGLVQDFIGWVQGVYRHADFFLVNSESTRRDLQRVASALGHQLGDDVIHTVTLDADYRKAGAVELHEDTLTTHRLEPHRFVLFVSTIEARKNHLTIFDAWLTLMKEHGTEAVPRLVCVGSRGWLNDAIFARLASSQMLRDKVMILSGVPDPELAELYRNCLFSVYPSFYEGWGLPVTEALSYGKTALVSRSSSLTEAGGDFVDYFTPGSQAEVTHGLSRLIFDPSYREAREAKIRQDFKPRSWETIAGDILQAASRWRSSNELVADLDHPIEVGRYYPLSRNAETSVFSGMGTGEIFRTGDRWWGPDSRGCWLKPGPGQLRIKIDQTGQYSFYIGLRALPTKHVPYDVTVLGIPTKRGELPAGETKWLSFTLDAAQPQQIFKVVIEGFAIDHIKPRADQEPQAVSLGVVGLMVCRTDDELTRGRFIEAISLDSLGALARGGHPAAMFRSDERH